MGLVVLATIISGVLITISISRGISKILAPMKQLATGDLTVEVPMVGEKTEMGQIADALEVFKQNMIAAEQLQGDQSASRPARCRKCQEDGEPAGAKSPPSSMPASRAISRAASIPAFDNEELNRWPKASTTSSPASITGLTETGTVLAALADTDLTVRMDGDYRGAFAKLQADTNAVADKLADIVGPVARHLAHAEIGDRGNPVGRQ